jgi:hypothetical protein
MSSVVAVNIPTINMRNSDGAAIASLVARAAAANATVTGRLGVPCACTPARQVIT